MGIGVATANSILVVSYARERLQSGLPAAAAALEAGFVRFRPVVMTALAMVVGMLPMALGTGEGGEQNAPLGRAVVGGLIFADLRDAAVCAGGVRPLIHEWRARRGADGGRIAV